MLTIEQGDINKSIFLEDKHILILAFFTDSFYSNQVEKTDLKIAKSMLGTDGIVFVAVKNTKVLFTSSKRGIQAFFDALNACGETLQDCSIADKVIGKAALLLACHMGAAKAYTPLASQHAVDTAAGQNIRLEYDRCVPYIINRNNDGMCPMEHAVRNIENPTEAFHILTETLQTLGSS